MTHTPSEEELIALKGQALQVPQLLRLFGLRVRDEQTVLLVESSLKAVDLTTVPSFATCNRGTPLQVLAIEDVSDTDPGTESPDGGEEDLPTGALPQHALRVGEMVKEADGFV